MMGSLVVCSDWYAGLAPWVDAAGVWVDDSVASVSSDYACVLVGGVRDYE